MHKAEDSYQEFKAWYDQYFSFLYYFLVGYFKKRQIYVKEEEIEDLVQNTFLSILERKSKTPIEYPMAYLKQAALSHARQFLDKKFKAGFLLPPELTLQNTPCPSSVSDLERAEEDQKVKGILSKVLNQMEHKIMYQRVVKGDTYKEIASEEGMPAESYLHTLYHRAKIKLSNHLRDLGYGK